MSQRINHVNDSISSVIFIHIPWCYRLWFCLTVTITELLDLHLLYPKAALSAEIKGMFDCQNGPVFSFFSWALEAESTEIQILAAVYQRCEPISYYGNEKTSGCIILIRLSDEFHIIFFEIANDLFLLIHVNEPILSSQWKSCCLPFLLGCRRCKASLIQNFTVFVLVQKQRQ